MKTLATATLKTKLQDIVENNPNTLKQEVAKEALEYDCKNIRDFFSDLLQHGCECGMIGSLIYYVDTHKFYDKNYYEIEELRNEYEDSIGEPLTIKGDLKNYLAWFSFEETACQLANELGFEI
jgi:hypothetical protein